MARKQRSNNPSFAQEPTQTIIRVALYARVSTLSNQDPEMQLRELREYSGRRRWQITEEYIDQGVSGCKESRPALNRLMSDACRRRFDAIIVWKIDRFGRSLKHLVNSLASKYSKRWLQVGLGCIQLSPSCPFRRLHTSAFSGQRGYAPRFLDMAPLI